MAAKPRTRPRSDAPTDDPLGALPAVGRWRHVAAVVRALGGTAEPRPAAWRPLTRLVLGATEPLRLLDALASDLERALNGDDHAADAVRETIRGLADRIYQDAEAARPFGRSLPNVEECSCCVRIRRSDCCKCGGRPEESEPLPPQWFSDGAGRDGPEDAPPGEPSSSAVLDETALTGVLLGAVAVMGAQERETAIDVVTALARGTSLLACLAGALEEGGEPALVERLDGLASRGLLRWVGPADMPMRTMSAGGPGAPAIPQLPGMPGLPDHVPGGLPGLPDVPGLPESDRFGDLITELLGRIKDRRRWDPDIWDHGYRWWDPPRGFIDSAWWKLVRCFLEVRRQLAARSEPPPPRPARAVWADGITEVTLSDPCAGGTVTIRGAGFGETQPSGVVLLLPSASGGCRPVAPTQWSNDRIVATLPAVVGSGPIGFADAAYVEAYDAWAARRNAADAALSRLYCAAYVPLLTTPFGQCPPSSAINRIRAGAPVITAFTANSETLLALEPGVPLRLRWTVLNAESTTVTRTSSTGPTFSGSTTLVDPVRSVHTFGIPTYGTRQTWTYQITASGACGVPVSRTVTVVAGKRPALRIESMEVTQSIQTMPTASVRLVQAKPTVVRVTVRHGLDGFGADIVPQVRGRIRVRGPDIGTSPWFDAANGSGPPMAASPGTSITVRATPSRDAIDDTLNFLVPPAWARGANTRFDVEVRVLGFGAASGFAGYSEQVTRSTGPVSYEPRRTLQLRFIRVAWGGTAAPTDAVCRDTLVGSVPLLPTPAAGISALAGVGVQNVTVAAGSNGNAERRRLLDDWDDEHNCSSFEQLFEWLGYDCPEDDGAIWVLIPGQFVRGEAHDIPSNVCMTPPSDGPYAAHELAHCLNQTHVRTRCGTAGTPVQGGDAASAWPNNGVHTDVPFDVVQHRALAVAGGRVGELMTYCPDYWPMPRRWDRLWDSIGS